MSKPVLFVSGLGRVFERAENINCLYEAYDGDKECMTTYDSGFHSAIKSGRYDLMVIDVFPKYSPGKTIMTWHSIQGGKYVGIGERSSSYRSHQAKLMDCIISSGSGAIDILSKQTLVPKEKILPLGTPRTDRYIGKKKGDGHTPLAEKRSYLYVPTYRGKLDPPAPQINFGWLDRNMNDDEMLYVKGHPYGVTINVPECEHIKWIPPMEPSVNYLYDADVVITDYSSIMFDAYLLNKPVVLFEKEPGYVQIRGMYFKYPQQYCSRYATTERELLQQMRAADKLTETEQTIIHGMADACDGHSCERICKLIDDMR